MKWNSSDPRFIGFWTVLCLFFGGDALIAGPCHAADAPDAYSEDSISKEVPLSERERARIHDMLTHSAAEPVRNPAVVETNSIQGPGEENLPPPPDEIEQRPTAHTEDAASSEE